MVKVLEMMGSPENFMLFFGKNISECLYQSLLDGKSKGFYRGNGYGNGKFSMLPLYLLSANSLEKMSESQTKAGNQRKELIVLSSVRGCLASIWVLVGNMVRQGLFTLLCLHKIFAGIIIYINRTTTTTIIYIYF